MTLTHAVREHAVPDQERTGGWRLPRAGAAWFTDALIIVLLASMNSAMVPLMAGDPATAGLWEDEVGGHVAGVLLALAVALRRYLPFTVLVVLSAGGLAGDYAGVFVWGTASLGIAVASYSVGRYLPLARALAGLGLGVAVDIGTTALSPVSSPEGSPGWLDQLFYLGWILASWWVGRLVRMRAFHIAELRARAERLERARDAHARAALAEERSRIARELHDVVAHHVSVMTVQATAGRRVIDRSPERARQTLVEIEQTGRQALSEMRRIVGVLRTPEGEDADRVPQPGLAGLADLVHQLSSTGMPVELRIEGDSVELPSGLDLTLYRVAQESLTNVLQHAGEQAGATVELRFHPHAVVLTVEDDGTGPTAEGPAADEPGHGLLGMRERVSLFGGELHTGPREGGGFLVRARLPLPRAGAGPNADAGRAFRSGHSADRPESDHADPRSSR